MKKKGRIGSSFDDFLKQEGIYEEVMARVMPLTRSFKDFVKSRIERDAKFRRALFQEAVQTLIDGDVDTAKSVLRGYINATIGVPALAEATGMPPKSLMRMFRPQGQSDRPEPVRRHRRPAGEDGRASRSACGGGRGVRSRQDRDAGTCGAQRPGTGQGSRAVS